MSQSVTERTYFQTAIAGLSEAMDKMKGMERDEQIKVYKEAKDVTMQYAVDLIKFGADKTLSGNNAIITANGKDFVVNATELRAFMGEEDFADSFPEVNTVTAASNERREERKTQEGPKKIDEPQTADEPAIMISVQENDKGQNEDTVQKQPEAYQILSFMAKTLMSSGINDAYKADGTVTEGLGSEIVKDITDIQTKILILEGERDDARKKAEDAKGQLKELEDKYEQLSIQYSMDKEQQDAQIEVLYQEKSELDYQLTQSVDAAEKNRRSITEEKKLLQRKIDDMSKELKAAERSEKNAQDKIKELQDKLSKHQKDEERYKNAIDELKTVKDKLAFAEKDLSDAKSDIEQKNFDIEKKDKEIKRLQENASSDNSYKLERKEDSNRGQKGSDKRVADLERQLNEQREKLTKNNKRAEEAEKHIENLKADKTALQEELNTVKAERDKLEDDIKKLKEGDEEKDAYYKGMEQEMSVLRTLAFEDALAGCLNNNAFNRDFGSVEKDSTILAMIGISGMKMTNLNYGRKAGDSQIKEVSNTLCASFGRENVYRIMGDQFTVIFNDVNHETVIMQLQEIKENLNKQQINISFGIAIGVNSKDLRSMLKIAEDGCNKMKSGAGMGFDLSPVKAEPQRNDEDDEDEDETDSSFTPDAPEEVNMDEMLMSYISG